QLVHRVARGGMLGAEHLLLDTQGALVERFSLLIVALRLVEACQGMPRARGVGMLVPEHLLIDAQCALVERFSLLILALRLIEDSQLVHRGARARMMGAEPL